MVQWFVLYTKPRSEKKVADRLKKIGLIVYCPMISEIRKWSDRKKKVETPLIPSYVFVQLDTNQRDLVFQVSGVVRYLFWLGKPATVKNEEINTLQEWIQGTTKIKIEGLRTGDLMEIKEGPFKGQEGFVKEIGENRLQLLLKGTGLKITLTNTL